MHLHPIHFLDGFYWYPTVIFTRKVSSIGAGFSWVDALTNYTAGPSIDNFSFFIVARFTGRCRQHSILTTCEILPIKWYNVFNSSFVDGLNLGRGRFCLVPLKNDQCITWSTKQTSTSYYCPKTYLNIVLHACSWKSYKSVVIFVGDQYLCVRSM